MMPKVSVIIPAFNSARFIKECIESVLNQTYKNLEVVVVNDGSIDDTEKIVSTEFPSVVYLYQKNSGPAAARNLGMKKSTGEYIAFMDSDDFWLPEKISKQMRVLNSNPGAKAVHTGCKIRKGGRLSDLNYTNNNKVKLFESLLLKKADVITSTLLFKKECLEKVGYFDEELITAEDVHLFLRLAYYYNFYFIDEALLIKNHHDLNLTNPNNFYCGSGTLKCLEKIEEQFPEYSRKKSRIMRQAYFLRTKSMAVTYAKKRDLKSALKFFIRALNYNKTFYNLLLISYLVTKVWITPPKRLEIY